MTKQNLLNDLNRLVHTMSAEKRASVKKASPGDGVENGTSAPATGAQMASNKTEAAKSTAAMVDGGAKTNPANGSVTNSTEGATAVATDGQTGTKGADLEVKKDADNGSVPQSSLSKTSSLVEELRKAASAEEAPVKEENAATKLLKKALAKAEPSPFELLADAYAKNLKTAADPMADAGAPAPAAPGADAGAPPAPAADPAAAGGDAGGGVDQLMQAIQSGQLDEATAEKLLMEGVQSGAISEQDLMEAMQAVQGQGGGGAGAAPADPAAGGAPAPAPMDPAAGAAPAPGGDAGGAPMVNDPGLEAKMAAADVGPEHPEYLAKLAHLYRPEMEAGYVTFLKLAEDMVAEDKGHDAPPGPDSISAGAPPADAPGAPAAGQMTDPHAGLAPQGADQKQALLQVLAEMGLTEDDLKKLLATPTPDPAAAPGGDPAAMKVAEYRVRVRNTLLSKVAALQEAACQTPKTK